MTTWWPKWLTVQDWHHELNGERFFWRYAHMELKWCILPRRCFSSNKLMFFCLAYRARRIITGPGEPVYEDRWYSKVNGLLQLIKVNSQ